MKQYLDLLKTIKERGTYKPAARENMPGTQSLFGYQFRHNLQEGFPLLTTKKMFWKGVVVELLWFLRGDTNIKYLVDNGVNIWNEDAYQYYLKKCKEYNVEDGVLSFDDFINKIKNDEAPTSLISVLNYTLGDCGFQYGKVWRQWDKWVDSSGIDNGVGVDSCINVDQIKNLINQLKKNPESRRHLVTAIDPAHDTDLALYWCHALFQFNCRPINYFQRINLAHKLDLIVKPELTGTGEDNNPYVHRVLMRDGKQAQDVIDAGHLEAYFDKNNIPKYYIDCQLYQRSADVFLGVPFNIASYALLTHVLAKICNMIPGEFIHTFGDVHIYDNHKEAVEEQLKRTPTELPYLQIDSTLDFQVQELDTIVTLLNTYDFVLLNYNPQAAIKAELTTGLKK